MKKHLYEIKKLDISAYLKWWFIKKKFAGTLSEVLENLTSPITLQNSLKRKFKIFEIGGNSVQDGTPTPESPVPIINLGNNINIFNKDTMLLNRYINVVSGEQISNEGYNTTDYIPVEINIKYCINKMVVGNSNSAGICYYDENKSFLFGESWNTLGYTTNSERKNILFSVIYQRIKYVKISIRTQTDFNALKIEEGLTSTGYSPYNCGSTDVKVANGTDTTVTGYEDQTVTFPLSEGQVLHLGDTLEDDGVHQRKITKVLDGTENYTMSAVDNLNRFALYLINSVSSNTRISVISSHFKYASSGNAEGIIFLNHKNIYMYPETDITTVADFQAFLAEQYANGTPVTLEYELAEPIIVPYTEIQQEAHDEIKALYSYKGTTYILSDNEPSPIFKIQYVKEE